MAPSESSHFSFPSLAVELDRINRPKRLILLTWTCFGLAVGAYAATVAIESLHTTHTAAWWLGLLALTTLIPATSILACWAFTTIPLSPTEITISEDEVRLNTPRRKSSGFRWSGLRNSLEIYDGSLLGTTWGSGAPRKIDFVLLSLSLRLRSPLTPEALSALVREAERNNFRVEGLSDGLNRGSQIGPPRVIRLIPPSPSSKGSLG